VNDGACGYYWVCDLGYLGASIKVYKGRFGSLWDMYTNIFIGCVLLLVFFTYITTTINAIQYDPCLGDTWIRCRTCEQRAKELNVGLSKMLQEIAVVDIDEETTTVVAFDKTSMAAKAEAERRLENLKLENIQKTVRLVFVVYFVLFYVMYCVY